MIISAPERERERERERESRVNFMQEYFSDDVSEIDEPLSVNNRTELFFSNDENTCTEHSNDFEEDGFIHMINEGCICSKICLYNFCTPDIVMYTQFVNRKNLKKK